jgi:hypothetical protein
MQCSLVRALPCFQPLTHQTHKYLNIHHSLFRISPAIWLFVGRDEQACCRQSISTQNRHVKQIAHLNFLRLHPLKTAVSLYGRGERCYTPGWKKFSAKIVAG